MNQQPDKLFRDKLQSFQAPAPSGAWNRIEANLDKKNNKVLWFRIAASLLLVAIATFLLWPTNSTDTTVPQSQLADKTKQQEVVQPPQKKETEIITPAPVPQNTIAKKDVAIRKRVETRQTVSTKENIVVEQKKEEALIAENINSPVEKNETADTSVNSTTAETQTTVAASTEEQKVKIIFSAEDIDNKYLDKKALAEATSDEKKSSTLKKLLDKAYDLKYNQDPFGDLRQKKNEILALNFRTDKQRKEN